MSCAPFDLPKCQRVTVFLPRGGLGAEKVGIFFSLRFPKCFGKCPPDEATKQEFVMKKPRIEPARVGGVHKYLVAIHAEPSYALIPACVTSTLRPNSVRRAPTVGAAGTGLAAESDSLSANAMLGDARPAALW